LRCKIAASLTPAFHLANEQRVRATGHLSFSAQSAQFHLLVRDLELLSYTVPTKERPAPQYATPPTERSIAPEWLRAIRRRAEAAEPTQLRPAELPDWIKALAPPGASFPTHQGTPAQWGKQRAEGALEPELLLDWSGAAELTRLESDEQLLTNLLHLLDRSEHEDVELTAEVLAQLSGSEEREASPPSPSILPRLPVEQADAPASVSAITPTSTRSFPRALGILFLAIVEVLAIVGLYLLARFFWAQ
jgi:hypothetical protein